MSVFRPAARVTAPDGREWEIYASKLVLRPRAPHADSTLEYSPSAEVRALGGLEWLLGGLVRLLVRVLVDVPVAAVRSLRSDEWTIEAVTFDPHRRSCVWTTTREFRGQVLAQVEGGLARGESPRPRNATFLGER